jgi:hypothetical protein
MTKHIARFDSRSQARSGGRRHCALLDVKGRVPIPAAGIVFPFPSEAMLHQH